VAEAALRDRTRAFVSGDVLVQSAATLSGVADAGAAAGSTNGFLAVGAAVNLGTLVNDARAFIGPQALVVSAGDVRVRADADEDVTTVAATLQENHGLGEHNRLYRNNGSPSPFAGVFGTDVSKDDLLTSSMALADLDGDGDLDLVTGSFAQATRRYLNDGTG